MKVCVSLSFCWSFGLVPEHVHECLYTYLSGYVDKCRSDTVLNLCSAQDDDLTVTYSTIPARCSKYIWYQRKEKQTILPCSEGWREQWAAGSERLTAAGFPTSSQVGWPIHKSHYFSKRSTALRLWMMHCLRGWEGRSRGGGHWRRSYGENKVSSGKSLTEEQALRFTQTWTKALKAKTL